MAKKQYVTKTPIQHNGEDVATGASIELDDKSEAPQLLAVNAIEPAPAKAAAKTEGK